MPDDLTRNDLTRDDLTRNDLSRSNRTLGDLANPRRPLRHEAAVPAILRHLGETHGLLRDFEANEGADRRAVWGADCGLPPSLLPLIELRASQINGCAFCVKMHLEEARRLGETQDRLDRLVVWDRVSDFSAMERAVFAWTEALTRLERGRDYAALRAALRAELSEEQISLITVAVGMINLWNRIQVSNH